MNKGIIVALIGSILAVTYFVARSAPLTVETQPAYKIQPQNSSITHASIELGNASIKAEIADTPDAIVRGLGGRDALADGEGMLFVFTQPIAIGFWMKDMRFPVDIIWIDNDRIIHVDPSVPVAKLNSDKKELELYYPPSPVTHVLEVPAGWVERNELGIGDLVSITY
jgi:uncharacterized protein